MTIPTIFKLLMVCLVTISLVMPLSGSVSARQTEDFCAGAFTPVAVPLNDLGTDHYVRMDGQPTGYIGGLYPGGSNQRPAAHEAAGVSMASRVRPRDVNGVYDPLNGVIGMISIGMSNASMEFQEFTALANADPFLNPRLVIVNGAQAGQTAEIWANPDSVAWETLAARLAHWHVSPKQVQVAWIKNVLTGSGDFPAKQLALKADLISTIQILKSRYPNVVIAYLSSRTRSYTYWQGLSPEPAAYESGFAVKWLIESQIAGAPELNYDPDHGTVLAPWLSWSAYLWTDGLNPRSDGLIWTANDMVPDCTHPSASGELKVANLLLNFFELDSTTGWFSTSPDEYHQLFFPAIFEQ